MSDAGEKLSASKPLDISRALNKPVSKSFIDVLHDQWNKPVPPEKQFTPVGIISDFSEKTPESQRSKNAQVVMQRFGEQMQNAAIYVSQRLNAIPEGRAKELAEQFTQDMHALGLLLDKQDSNHNLATRQLDSIQTEEIDRLLAGEVLYRSRMQKVQELGVDPERVRQETLAQYFTVLAKAEIPAPPSRKRGVHSPKSLPFREAFLEKTQASFDAMIENKAVAMMTVNLFSEETRKLTREVYLPEQMKYKLEEIEEFIASLDTSISKIKDDPSLGNVVKLRETYKQVLERTSDAKGEDRRLTKIINMDSLGKNLRFARELGDPTVIALAETIAVGTIQNAISLFSSYGGAFSQENTSSKAIYECVGASSIMGTLLDDLSIPYNLVSSGKHATLIVAYSDMSVVLVEPQGILEQRNLTEKAFTKHDGASLSVKDIHNAIVHNDKTITVTVTDKEINDLTSTGISKQLVLKPSSIGITSFMLNNMDRQLRDENPNTFLHVAALEVAIDAEDPTAWVLLADAYEKNGLDKEAIAAYQKAIELDPNDPMPYFNLGSRYYHLNMYPASMTAYQRAIELDPENPKPYFNLAIIYNGLNDFANALKAYQKFVNCVEVFPSTQQAAHEKFLGDAKQFIADHNPKI